MVEEEGADPDVSDTARMDWQSALHKHQATPGSCDLEGCGKLTPEWPSTAGRTRTTTSHS